MPDRESDGKSEGAGEREWAESIVERQGARARGLVKSKNIVTVGEREVGIGGRRMYVVVAMPWRSSLAVREQSRDGEPCIN